MEPDQIIDALGGTGAVAVLCQTTPAAVSQWRKKGIPNARLMYLRAVRPEVFVVATPAPSDESAAA